MKLKPFILRLKPEQKDFIKIKAKEQNISMNKLIKKKLFGEW